MNAKLKNNTHFPALLAASVLALALANCKSGDLKPGESKDIKDGDNVIGQVQQTSEKEQSIYYDADKNQKLEKMIYTNEGKITKVDYDTNEDGAVDKQIQYENGEPKKVLLYENGEVNAEGMISKGMIVQMDYLKKGKRAFFKEDGSLDRIEDLK